LSNVTASQSDIINHQLTLAGHAGYPLTLANIKSPASYSRCIVSYLQHNIKILSSTVLQVVTQQTNSKQFMTVINKALLT